MAAAGFGSPRRDKSLAANGQLRFYIIAMTHFASLLPWTDRRGQLSVLRLTTFAALLLPAIAIAVDLVWGPLRPEPYEHALHESGTWAVRILLVSLAITPLRRILAWNRLIGIRRMIGVAVLCYAVLHLGLYAAQENWDLVKVGSEIVSRIYLVIGFFGLLGLAALGATSFDVAVRKLGPVAWTRLHKAAYGIAVLALIHFFLQSKSDVTQPTLMAGLFVLLMGYRLAAWLKADLSRWLVLVLCALVAGAATMAIEYGWYALATGLPADRIFLANFDIGNAIRPAVWVGIAGLFVAVMPWIRTGMETLRDLRAAKRTAKA